MKRIRKSQKIACALSGGVDSSVAAALLKRQGYDLVGVFMRLWSEGVNESANKASTLDDEAGAKAVAKKLDIPFKVYDLSQEFKDRVVAYFLKEFDKGGTPNPCVVCNKEIKFGVLLDKAIGLGADFVATGHYAKIKTNSKVRLFEAKDKTKDQSYFLWQLKQNRLKKILFPLSHYYKKDVKKKAKELDLPVEDTPESNEICFINDSLYNFLARHLSPIPGDIVNSKGEKLGEHEGLLFYTIGQRKGIDLSGGPFYVLEKDMENNRLIVTKNEKELYQKELKLKRINWISGAEPEFPLNIKARIRYRHEAVPAKIFKKSGKYILEFKNKQRAITPGQSAVFYKRGEVLGGGVIS